MRNSEFESPLPHLDESPETPVNTGRFTFWGNYTGEMQARKYIHYKPAKVRGTAPRRFIDYYYRKPPELMKEGEKNPWQRFKVYEDINRNKSEEYALLLCEAVNYALENGYNPFTDFTKTFKVEEKVWTIQQALLYFIQKWKERGLQDTSVQKYERTARQFMMWIPPHLPAREVTREHIEQFLSEMKRIRNWTNRNYNNTLSFLNTAFLFLQEKKIITDLPTARISKMKSASKKHKYFDEKTLSHLITVLKEHDPYLYFAFQVVYYLCVRSEKELVNIRVGNIFPDRGQVFLQAGDTKGNADRFIPMPDHMLKIFEQRGIFNYPPDYYLFHIPMQGKFYPDATPGPTPVKRLFFSKRFRRIRRIAGLSEDHTLYGAKHTRIVHLKKDGAKDDEIMSLTGHTSFAAYSKYLRDLGVDANLEKLSALSREI